MTSFPYISLSDRGNPQVASVCNIWSFTLFKIPALEGIPDLTYGIFGRSGGISPKPYDTLNVAFSTGDSKERVLHNIKLIKEFLNVNVMVSCGQVHGNKIIRIDEAFLQKHRTVEGFVVAGDGDGLITDMKNVGLLIKTGDCQAVFLVDPLKKVIANIHCGWRGNVCNILQEAINTMKDIYGVDPSNVIAAVSPSLGPCCAEFINYREELPFPFWKYQPKPRFFDLWRISTNQLIEAGVKKDNVHISGWCTRCNPQYFFSYRRQKISGRMASVLAWKEV